MTTGTSQGTVATVPTSDEIKAFQTAMEKWAAANEVAGGMILGLLSTNIELLVNLDKLASVMYNKLKAHMLKQSSGTSALDTWANMTEKRFEADLTVDNFKEHANFFCTKNAALSAVSTAFNDHLLMWNLIYSLCDREETFWSMVITSIVITATNVNQWAFDNIANRLCNAVQSNCHKGVKSSTTSTSQVALNVNASKPSRGRYSGSPCMYPGCPHLRSHLTEDCWTREREEQKNKQKAKQKARKAKKKAVKSSSELETGSDLDTDSKPAKEKKHHTNKSQGKLGNITHALMASLSHGCSYHRKMTTDAIFIAHPDSGASNCMCHKLELFDSELFETLSKPIPISLGDDSEIFTKGKGTIHLMFNLDRKKKEGKFTNTLFIPDLKVTLLSVGQSAQLPHCKVVFNNNICKYVNKNTGGVITHAHASGNDDLL